MPLRHLEETGEWNFIGLSRRGGTRTPAINSITIDLLDTANCNVKLQPLIHVTHICYAAYQDRPTWGELVPPNLAMLVNVIEAAEPIAKKLQHISLLQGYKIYGAHLGPFTTPAKENDGGHLPPEFNVDRQDYLENKQRGRSWSVIRPSVVAGTALGNPMNVIIVIAVYASISKELGSPLRFPEKLGAYEKLLAMRDAGLLASATVWAAMQPQCANQAFNITKGDLFRWNDLWPKIANYFKLETAPQLQMSLPIGMADKQNLWQRIQEKYGLTKHTYEELSSWLFGEAVLGWDYDFFADGTKARRLGLHEFIGTEQMLYSLFDELKAEKVIP